ncbi:hypothetical protein HY629_01645, partial [Candidatus Uhrbacteria bacterium]|nr:hypothetical protein [Candidatus Uhrbacteria bacterium]
MHLNRRDLLIIITNALFVILFYIQPLLRGGSLVPFDILQEYDLVFHADGIRSANYLTSDMVTQTYPLYAFVSQQFRNGAFPWWNPYSASGMPVYADPQAQIFEFTHVLGYLLRIPPEHFLLFSALITTFLAGVFTALYLRNVLGSIGGALFGGLAFMLSAPAVAWVTYPLLSTAIWIPWILLTLDRVIVARRIRWLPFLTLGILFSIAGGYPQVSVLTFLLASIYACVRCVSSHAPRRIVGSIILFAALGILTTSVLIGPILHTIRQSEANVVGRGWRAQTPLRDAIMNEVRDLSTNLRIGTTRAWQSGVLAFMPTYYGSPLTRDYRGPERNQSTNMAELALYSGIITILLALSAFVLRKTILTRFWLWGAVVTFGVAARIPFVDLIGYFPIINKMSLNRFRLFFVFAVVVLASSALTYCIRRLRTAWPRSSWVAHGIVILVIIVTFVDLYRTGAIYHAASPFRAETLMSNPVVQFLRDQTTTERFVGIGPKQQGLRAPLIPNISLLLQLFDIRGYNPLLPYTFTQLADAFLSRRASFTVLDAVFDERVIDLMSVRYVLCPLTGCAKVRSNEPWPVVYHGVSVDIVENPSFVPRSYIAYQEHV